MALSALTVMNAPSCSALMPTSSVAQSAPNGAMKAPVSPSTNEVANRPGKGCSQSCRRSAGAVTRSDIEVCTDRVNRGQRSGFELAQDAREPLRRVDQPSRAIARQPLRALACEQRLQLLR